MVDISVVIVIPIYKSILSSTEEISLKQLNKVLGKYPRVFIAPKSLDYDFESLGEGIGVERFDDRWFQGVTAYSCLMMQKEFYERFSDYEYMLLYQLDAFVFSDRLKEFCDMGYDYIGAPIGRFAYFWHAIGVRVGNGGFSLRKIPSIIRVLNDADRIIKITPFFHAFLLAEDVFFAYCGKRDDVNFRIADVETAFEFSVQENAQHVYQKMQMGWRPFGCHGWSAFEKNFWWPVIEGTGYVMPEMDQDKVVYRYWVVQEYILSRGKFNLQPAWGWLKRGEITKLNSYLQEKLVEFPEGHDAWCNQLLTVTCFWCAVIEGLQRGGLSADMDCGALLTTVYRIMLQGETKRYLWEMWDTMLPLVSNVEHPVRDKVIHLVLGKKLEKHIMAEQEKIRGLWEEKEQKDERAFRIERQVRLQMGQKLFEKALAWNISTETDVWKQYTEQLMNL